MIEADNTYETPALEMVDQDIQATGLLAVFVAGFAVLAVTVVAAGVSFWLLG